jgi:pyruvate carboxylase
MTRNGEERMIEAARKVRNRIADDAHPETGLVTWNKVKGSRCMAQGIAFTGQKPSRLVSFH